MAMLRDFGEKQKAIEGVALNRDLVESAIQMAEQQRAKNVPAEKPADTPDARNMVNGSRLDRGQAAGGASWDSSATWDCDAGWGQSDWNAQTKSSGASWWETQQQGWTNNYDNSWHGGDARWSDSKEHGDSNNDNGGCTDTKGVAAEVIELSSDDGDDVVAHEMPVPDSDDDLAEAATPPSDPAPVQIRKEMQAAPEKSWTPDQELMIERMVAYLRQSKDLEKALRTIKSPQSTVPADIVAVAIARFDLAKAAEVLGGVHQ